MKVCKFPVVFGLPTSMISPCKRAKALLTRSGGARNKTLQSSSARFRASRRWFLLDPEPDIHLLSQANEWSSQKIELVISCQSRNNPMGASGAYAPSLSRLLTRPGRLRAEEILLIFFNTALRGGAVFSFYYKKVFLATIHGNQVSHELSCYGQRRAIGVALLFFPVVEHRQVRAVSRRHLGRLDQHRLQMLVALLRERGALDDVCRTILGTAQSTVADGLLDR